MILRKAEPSDDSAIGELLVESFITTYKEKMPEVVVTPKRIEDLRDVESRRKNGVVFVAELDGKIVGTVTLFPWGAPGSEAWTEGASSLRMMALLPDYQGKGLSRALIRQCLEVSREWEAPSVQLHIRRGAHGISEMYERFGFKRCPEGDLDLLPEIFLDAYQYDLFS